MPIETIPTPGEANHVKGEDGTRRAKLWLDSTTRVSTSYTNIDDAGPRNLAFKWPHGGQAYSYDLGGTFRGKPYAHDVFAAECKMYDLPRDQGNHFDKFLAQTYCTLDSHSRLIQHFLWITWSPFRSTTWNSIYSKEAIRSAVVANRKRIFGIDDEDQAAAMIDEAVIDAVEKSIWIVVLDAKQETLVISIGDRAELAKLQLTRGA